MGNVLALRVLDRFVPVGPHDTGVFSAGDTDFPEADVPLRAGTAPSLPGNAASGDCAGGRRQAPAALRLRDLNQTMAAAAAISSAISSAITTTMVTMVLTPPSPPPLVRAIRSRG